ncbi:vWA domain-containing protein [Jatrophihabitans sp. YIM 134969]
MTRTTHRRRGWRAVALTAAAFAALGAVFAGPVGPAAATEGSGAPATGETLAPVMIVLDASGSMNQTDAPGSRIDAAKTAVRNLVDGLPTDARVGLTVYGTHTGSSNAEKTAGCKDISQLAAVGRVDKAALTTAVDGIQAKGYTPIGASLQKAAAALPAEGPRSIVLVSDGEDTCSPPPPCDVAQQLKQQGVDLIVHTVGFKVDAAARAQLSCIAQATGGTYSDASDAGSLGTSLETQVTRGLEPYDVTGDVVVGSAGPGGAPELAPGQYQDTLANGGDDYGRSGPGKYYAVDLHEGETPYLSATIVPAATPSDSAIVSQMLLTATLTAGAADTSGCLIRRDTQSVSALRKFLTTSIVVAPGEVGGPDWPSGCPTEGTFFFFVTRNFGGADPLPMEIAYRSEPAADTAGLPEPATERTSPPLPTPSQDVQEVTGGSSFNSAVPIEPGRTVSDTIVFGEDRYFKVHLDWGQQLAFRFDTQKVPGISQLGGVQSRVYAASPVRQELGDVTVGSAVALPFLGGLAGQLAGSTAYPVRWTNRDSNDSLIQPYAIDGDYYLIFSAGYDADGTKTAVPYTLTVDVTGAKEKGPVYGASEQPTQGPTDDPSGAQSNGSSTVAGDNDREVAAESTSWSTQRTTLVGGSVGVAVLAAIVLGWLLLGRRRAPRPASPPIMPPPGGINRD